MLLFHQSSPPAHSLQRAHAAPLYPEFHPAQTFRGQLLRTAGGGSPEPPGSRPAAEQLRPGPAGTPSHFPGVAWDSEATHLRLRSWPLCARPVGPGTPQLGRPGKASVPRRRAAPPPQTAGARVRWGAASGPRPPPGPRGERELGDPARLRRQVGRAGWGWRRRDLPCAPPSPASRGAGAAEPSPPLAQRTQASDPGRRESALRSAPSGLGAAGSLSRGDLLCSDLSRRPGVCE